MPRQYEQKVTITLTHDQAIAVRVALRNALTAWEVGLKTHTCGLGDLSNAAPDSAVGVTQALLRDLEQVALGNKSTRLASYEMVRTEHAA